MFHLVMLALAELASVPATTVRCCRSRCACWPTSAPPPSRCWPYTAWSPCYLPPCGWTAGGGDKA